ncbi:hypothetical protein QUB11_09995 [Microcoleus sp. B6-A1]
MKISSPQDELNVDKPQNRCSSDTNREQRFFGVYNFWKIQGIGGTAPLVD